MAVVHPDTSNAEVVFPSQAEEQVYRLAKNLPDGWRVYHSVTLSMKDERDAVKDGEIDFVLYHPTFGVIVVEVKGGRISLDGQSGTFYSVNRYGRSFAIKNPFQQAITWRNRFVRFLRAYQINVPVSHAVCFPSVDEAEFPPHAIIERSILLGRSGLDDLEHSLQKIVHSFHRDDFLRFNDVGPALDRLLIGSTFSSKPLLREYIDTHEAQVSENDLMHDVLISPMTGVPRLGVEGEAGTGKTVLAMTLARHFRDRGQRVLYLVSSPLLAARVGADLGHGIAVKGIQELASFFGVNLLVTPSDWQGSPRDYVQEEAPERLRKAIATSHDTQKEQHPYEVDVLIVDEAQDVQPYWWVALEELLANKDSSRLYAFFDREQGVFGGSDESKDGYKPEDTLPVPTQYMRLQRNYRNTKQISDFSRGFRRSSQLHIAAASDRAGYLPVIVRYKDVADAQVKLRSLVQELGQDRGVQHDEIVVLSGRAPESKESALYGVTEVAGLKLTKLTAERLIQAQPIGEGQLGVSTIAAFKGLESKIVIAVNLSEYNLPAEHPIMSSLMYVAMTRAKHMLYVFVKEHDNKDFAVSLQLQNMSRGVSIVLDAHDRAGERLGKVIHYNPDRAGILALTTPDGDSSERVFMFDPDLKRSGIHQVKPGDELTFRIRNEGGITFAVDLKLAASG